MMTWGAKLFFKLSARFGNSIYNFKGLSFHKSKYRGVERPLYFASNSFLPSSDIYLAFASAGLADGCLATFGKLMRGMLAAGRNGEMPIEWGQAVRQSSTTLWKTARLKTAW